MKRWILAAAVAMVGVLVATVAVSGAWGTTFAAWNATAKTGATVTAGTWATAAPDPVPVNGGITEGNAATGFTTVDYYQQFPEGYCVNTVVTTTSTSPVVWLVRVDLTAIPFNGKEPQQVTNAVKRTDLSASGVAYYGGAAEKTTVVAGQSITVTFCQWQGNSPAVVPAGSSTYTAGESVLRMGSDQWTACVDTVVTGHSKFYVGYQVAFNWQLVLSKATWLSDANRAVLLGKTLTNWTTGGAWAVTRSGYDYVGHGTNTSSNASIQNGQTRTVSACL